MSKVYINLTDQKEPVLDFKNIEAETVNIVDKNVLYFKKIVEPSDEEKINHKNFLKTSLKKNFF